MLSFNSQLAQKRPSESPVENPRAWWRFAIHVVLGRVEEENKSWQWNTMKARINDKNRYVQLYRQVIRGKSASTEMIEKREKELDELHRKLSFEDIILYVPILGFLF